MDIAPLNKIGVEGSPNYAWAKAEKFSAKGASNTYAQLKRTSSRQLGKKLWRCVTKQRIQCA
ncbi:hypothetical protein HMPREF3163_00130 [Actinomyces sp. HMSC08A01]|nr:hypothetical protein HMPREF3163_00130 [Actinomyces sp. HMSC08A01]